MVSVPIFSVRTHDQLLQAMRAAEFTLSDKQMQIINELTQPAIDSPCPVYGSYPYSMLEFGSPSLPKFFSRALLYGDTEATIVNHRTPQPYHYFK